MDFYIIDAFTTKTFGGNPAGVIIYDELSEKNMQLIASEIGYSETAFVKLPIEEFIELRYFTPSSEIDLCGHATISVFSALLDCGLINNNSVYRISTKAGMLDVFIEDDNIMMEQATPELGKQIDDIKLLCSILNLDIKDIGDNAYNLYPQIAYSGLYDIMLPVKTQEALNRIKPDFKALSKYSEDKGVVGVHAFTLDTNDAIALCRNFAPLYGIDEEAATGTSNGALTYYLYMNNVIKSNGNSFEFHQGLSMNRASSIFTKIIENEVVKVFVGGKCKIVSKGKFFL